MSPTSPDTEDFSSDKASDILQKYRMEHLCFNDDIQGTGAVTLAGVFSALQASGQAVTDLRDQRIVVAGAGSAGLGVATTLLQGMVHQGMSTEEAQRQFWVLDQHGLLTYKRRREFTGGQRFFSRRDEDKTLSLLETVQKAKVPRRAWEPFLAAGPLLTAPFASMAPSARHSPPSSWASPPAAACSRRRWCGRWRSTPSSPSCFPSPTLRRTRSVRRRRRTTGRTAGPSLRRGAPSTRVRLTVARRAPPPSAPFPPLSRPHRLLWAVPPETPVEVNGQVKHPSQCNNVFVFPGAGCGALAASCRS